MKTDSRWMKWVLAESAKPGVTLPWHRAARQAARGTPQAEGRARQPAPISAILPLRAAPQPRAARS